MKKSTKILIFTLILSGFFVFWGTASIAQQCQLTSVRWEKNFINATIIDSPMVLKVEGVDCSNQIVWFDIYEEDPTGVDILSTQQARFDSDGNSAETLWNIDVSGDQDEGFGNYEIYFVAIVGEEQVQSNTITVPLNSQTGCINCNDILAPDACLCSNGAQLDRGSFSSCFEVCINNVGDSLGGEAVSLGSGGDGGSSEPAPFSFKSFPFQLTPPEGTPTTLAGLVDVISIIIFNTSIPIAVILIVTAGIVMLTSSGNPQRVQKSKDILRYTIIGIAIIFIGRGFITLIISLLEGGP